MRKLSASILSADFGRLAEHVREAEQAGVDWITWMLWTDISSPTSPSARR